MHRFKYPHYFSSKINREVQEVYWYTAIHSLALAMVVIFEPIYLYSLGFSVSQILWFYVQVYVWFALLVSFGAKFAGRFGYKHAIFLANIFYVLYWLVLFGIGQYHYLFYLAPALFALQKSWFWPAYDADMAVNSAGSQRGREVGVLFSLIQIVFIAGPFLGGFLAYQFGFLYLFLASAALMLVSAYPLFRSPEIYSRHEFKFKNLLTVWREHKSNFWGYWGFAEDLMIMSLWPIYMFLVIPNTLRLGAVSAIATVIGTVLMLYIGKLTDRQDKRRLILASSVVYGATWILRFLGRDIFSVLTFDALTKTAKDAMTVPVMSLTYEKSAEQNPRLDSPSSARRADYAIAYSVFFEFSLSVAKIFTALAGIAIFYFVSDVMVAMGLTFALVGVLTMFYGFLK